MYNGNKHCKDIVGTRL